ncbi:methyltransferase domain-containing protein [Streptomyces sp. NPDC057654]|uniref:methyltransferase domain-containing protein n=1 Tax=Streptomyces sp. NPDC057654 TaxID=3346196 RepID=UPI0036B12BF3
MTLQDLKRTCGEEISSLGYFDGAGHLRDAFDNVPREAFAPDRFWLPEKNTAGLFPLVSREITPDMWTRAVYSAHTAIITQMDDGQTAQTGAAQGRFTSSLSAAGVVFKKLALLNLQRGQRVLEIGTGTGYNAALLAECVGGDQVVTVEIDPDLADQARATLRQTGYAPVVVCADGENGYPEGEPYDRIISTASVQHIPYAWVEQAVPESVILTPYGPSTLLRLVVGDCGAASGMIVGTASYMTVRGQRGSPSPSLDDLLKDTWSAGVISHRSPDVSFIRDTAGAFALHQLLPDVLMEFGKRATYAYTRDGSAWAAVWPDNTVKQWGTRRLADELTQLAEWWTRANMPAITRYGLTVTADGQTLWLDTPDNPVSRLS